MNNIVIFIPRTGSSDKKNLEDFIYHCRNNLTLYEEQGGFAVNEWHYHAENRKYAMTFSKYKEYSDAYSYDPMEEPFLTFAKAYIRYRQSQKQNKNIADTMVALRTIHDALLEIHGTADVLYVDGLVQQRAFELINERFPKSDKRYFWGGKLVLLYEFLIDKAIVPALPVWKNHWKKAKEKANRTDHESREWQEERCPSLHQMLSLADCFTKAVTPQDRYWSSVFTLLMFAPSRGGELSYLTIHSLQEEDGALYVCWFGEKGFGEDKKWVPEPLHDAVREAFSRLLQIGQPARDAAKFAYDNPGVFFRHANCSTPNDFPENKPLDALQFAHAMDFSPSSIARISDHLDDHNCESAWNVCNAHQSKWIQNLRRDGNPTYQHLAQYVLNNYKSLDWPEIPHIGRPVWEALLLVRDNEFHAEHQIKQFSWVMPSMGQLNDQLSQRPLKNTIPTIFQRFGVKEMDGSEMSLVSHQLRVWISTNSERGGMDAWKLAKWAGRARIKDNRHYDLRPREERELQAVRILGFDERPTALEAIEMNLPVSYEDLGIDRLGIADVTLYGMCVKDYAMAPCTKGGECMICKDHRCIKGMPKTLDRIIRLENQVESQLRKAERDEGEGVYGASVWKTHFVWKLSHIRTQRIILESEDTPKGAIIFIPPAHDPSSVERALQQRGYDVKASGDINPAPSVFVKDSTPNRPLIDKLLGFDDA